MYIKLLPESGLAQVARFTKFGQLSLSDLSVQAESIITGITKSTKSFRYIMFAKLRVSLCDSPFPFVSSTRALYLPFSDRAENWLTTVSTSLLNRDKMPKAQSLAKLV